jgi:hypothetical protein
LKRERFERQLALTLEVRRELEAFFVHLEDNRARPTVASLDEVSAQIPPDRAWNPHLALEVNHSFFQLYPVEEPF